ncbi:stonustoxin subunit beta-like [Clupea harengus]|uniref:Stonustoxin subunit beta-like n=1 Tax=Clupea harengus TaxID=7950 RepID=A0A8M1KBN5_CLUHA|nr:stonustoxin subunit beta-like [Clupea harengus]
MEPQLQHSSMELFQGGGPEFSVLVVSALSRPLDLGMLYNVRNDRLIPGFTLWKTEDIKSKTHVRPHHNTWLQVAMSESLSEKTSLLDVSASLKASFLCGLVEVGGSAKYLNKKTSSSRHCSVTLGYHVTTEFKELMISELETPKPELFDKTDATHVVSAVLYGADALMEFQEMASDDSKKQEIQGNLTVMIKKIPSIEISGDGSLKMDDEDKKKVKNFSCKFHGDFYLKELPSTYEEAVKVYKELPSLLGEKWENAVPVKVWLYPLSKLTNTESKLKKMISERLVSLVEKVMDDFHQAEVRTNDLLKSSKEIKAEEIVHKLEEFQSSLRVFTTELLRKMRDLIPAIREGNMEETALRDLLKSQDASGFSVKEMEQWLDGKETEINVVTMNIKQLKCEIKLPGRELDSLLMDPDVKDVFVFSFTSLSYEEPYLKTISKAVENFKSGSAISTPEQDPTQEVPWYKRPDVKENLASSRSVFKSVPFKNKVISFISDPDHPGASVCWYVNAALKDPRVTSMPAQFACKLTLDPNTANKHLLLSEGNRKVTRVKEWQPYPDHPDRFTLSPQVLSREPLTGRCYWECQWDVSGGNYLDMGVAYQSTDRNTYLTSSDKSWVLGVYDNKYYVYHSTFSAGVPTPPSRSSRVGVLLDREACTLSFYSVCSDTLTLLYTFENTTFTDEPLYAGFYVGEDSSLTLC